MRRLKVLVAACGLTLLAAVPADAQLNGSHSLGDFGVQSGSQPQPGFYAALFYFRYDTDTIKDEDGKIVRPAPDSPGSIGITAAAPILWYVSKARVLGANYGAMVVLPWANGALEAPAFTVGQTVDTSFADMLIRPVDLGWHSKGADVTAGFQFYAPTGTYERGGSENVGRGMWTYEPFVGTTVYSTRSGPSVSPPRPSGNFTATRKTPTRRSDSCSRSRAASESHTSAGGLILGAAYYAQWKLTADQLAEFDLPDGTGQRRGFSRQAQSVCLRAGRDAAGREQVEALRTGEHPLPLGNRRALQDTRAHPGRHRDLSGSQREAAVTEDASNRSQAGTKVDDTETEGVGHHASGIPIGTGRATNTQARVLCRGRCGGRAGTPCVFVSDSHWAGTRASARRSPTSSSSSATTSATGTSAPTTAA